MSLLMPLNEITILQIAKIYSVPHQPTLNIKILSVQQQQGTVDCGVFSIANSVEVCMGNNPEHISYDQAKMRKHLLECFTIGKLSPFPKSSTHESLPRPMTTCHEIELYCHCRMPEEYDIVMISCDVCLKWFHCTCVKVNPDKVPDNWMCVDCVKK